MCTTNAVSRQQISKDNSLDKIRQKKWSRKVSDLASEKRKYSPESWLP